MITHRITLSNGTLIEFFGNHDTLSAICPEYKSKQRAEQKRKQKRRLQNNARRKNRGK